VSEIRPGIRRLFRLSLRSRARSHRDADEELSALLDARIADLEARGLPSDVAREEALRRLGTSVDDARQRVRDSAERREHRLAIAERMHDLVQDVRYAARGLARTPGFTVVAIVTLAIGIGATTALFSAVNALILRPLPFRDPASLMSLSLTMPAQEAEPARDDMIWSYPKFAMFRDAQSSFESLALYTSAEFNLTTDEAHRMRGEWVGARYLDLLGAAPRIGRDFDPSLDAHPGARREIVLTDVLWRRQFAGDPAVIGRVVAIDGQSHEIVGVARPGFRGLTGQAELFVPLMTRSQRELGGPQAHSFNLVGRRKDGVSEARAIADVTAIGVRMNETFPSFQASKSNDGASGGATARSLDDTRLSPLIRRSLLVLFGAVVLVLLIACVNIGNLLTARAAARRREVAVRLAIGAGRERLVRLFLAESLVLTLAGAVASIALAWWGIRALNGVDPAALAWQERMDTTAAVELSAISLDLTALLFMLAVAVLVGVAFGLVPALGATRASLTPALKATDGAADVGRPRAFTARRVLIVTEVALAIVLLAGAGLMLRSLTRLLGVDPGFDARQVLTMRLSVPRGVAWRDSLPSLYGPLLERLGGVPGVVAVGLSNCIPLEGICNFTRMEPQNDPTAARPERPGVGVRWATPSYFSAMGVQLRRGRLFTDADRDGSPKVVLVSETLAKLYWPNDDPIGKHVGVYQGGFASGAEIVGIVGDVRTLPDSAPKPDVYLPYAQSPQAEVVVFARVATDPLALSAALQRVVGEVSPGVPVHDVRTMESRMMTSMAQPRFTALLMALFAATALTLAVVGIWGVMSSFVGQRTREMGIRMALGADASRVMRSIVGEGLVLTSSGAVLGLVGAFLLTRVLRSLLYEISPSDPLTYVTIVVVLSAAAVLASWFPARRATRVDPLVALRSE
jgi:predicted permease